MDKFVTRKKKDEVCDDLDRPGPSSKQPKYQQPDTPKPHQPSPDPDVEGDVESDYEMRDVDEPPGLVDIEQGAAGKSTKAKKSLGPSKKDKTSKKKKYNNKFSPNWLGVPEFKEWLQKSEKVIKGDEFAFCKVCRVDIAAHRNDISKHGISDKHKKLMKEIKSNKTIDKSLYTVPQKIKRAEIKLAGFIAENNLPLSLSDSLSELLIDIFDDSDTAKGIKQHRTKATAIIKNVLGDEMKKNLCEILSGPGNFFSLIMDETTDQGSIKQCAFVVIFYDFVEMKTKTRFFEMREVPSSTANDLLTSLKATLENNNVPQENLVGFSSDTTNVMFGEHHSVVSLLKDNMPEIVCIKCSCHLIHLVASKACLKLPRSIEDLIRNLGSHFSRSYHRQQKFLEFQQFFSVEIHKILTVATTRWLSLKACVDRVLEQFTPLQEYLRESVFEDPSKTTEEMMATMNNKFTKLYLEFMSYTLGLFVSFNCIFQTESPMLHRVKPEVENLLRNLCANYMKRDAFQNKNMFEVDHKNPRNFVENEKIYLGLTAQGTLEEVLKDPQVPKNDLTFFFNSCRSFYVEAVSQIKDKFDVSKDPIFSIVAFLDPQNAQDLKEEHKSLRPVFKRFNVLQKFIDPQTADLEWRQHSNLDHKSLNLDPELPPDDYWRKVFSLKTGSNQPMFKNLKKVIQLLLVLPFSNAAVERAFSTLNNIKTSSRNRLDTKTVNALMVSKEEISARGGSAKFEPSTSMLAAKVWK